MVYPLLEVRSLHTDHTFSGSGEWKGITSPRIRSS
jgi:hypothetical protein